MRKKVQDAEVTDPRLDPIITLGRIRFDFQQGRVAEGNHLKAMLRKFQGTKETPPRWRVDPLVVEAFTHSYRVAFDALKEGEKEISTRLRGHVRAHPVARAFVDGHRGIGYEGLGMILAFLPGGDLTLFKSPGALWAYCGYGVTAEGRAPKRLRGVSGGMNYSPKARTVLYRQAATAMRGTGPYRDLYDQARAAVLARPRVGPSECPFGVEHTGFERQEEVSADGVVERRRVDDSKKVRPCFQPCPGPKRKGHETCLPGAEHSGHVHAHALRIVAKRILKDLWIAFNPERAEPGR